MKNIHNISLLTIIIFICVSCSCEYSRLSEPMKIDSIHPDFHEKYIIKESQSIEDSFFSKNIIIDFELGKWKDSAQYMRLYFDNFIYSDRIRNSSNINYIGYIDTSYNICWDWINFELIDTINKRVIYYSTKETFSFCEKDKKHLIVKINDEGAIYIYFKKYFWQ